MTYGDKPEDMDESAWTVECQARHIAREMRQGRDRAARSAIFERWSKVFPGVTKARVVEIWKAGVPMPEKGASR